MNLKLRKADRSDLKILLSLVYQENTPIINTTLINKFDEILAQTNHHIMLAFNQGILVGTATLTIVDGIGENFPFAVIESGITKDEFISKQLVAECEHISNQYECIKTISITNKFLFE